MERRFLIFGAHPDDCDLLFGGSAILLGNAGGVVKFVSMTNGNAGHQRLDSTSLAARRREETKESALAAGIAQYEVLNVDDGFLTPSLENRAAVIRIIREFNPHVVLAHRPCDYHADHRAVGTLVGDASFLAGVPLYLSQYPVPESFDPMYGYLADGFSEPSPFVPDAAVVIDSVVERKYEMLICQSSQFFEWLPWCLKLCDFDASKMSNEEKRAHVEKYWLSRNSKQANLYREFLAENYGDAGRNAKYAEFFSLMPLRDGKDVDRFRRLLSV